MLKILERIWSAFGTEADLIVERFKVILMAFVKEVFLKPWTWFSIDLQYPVPRIIGRSFALFFDLIDAISDSLAEIPGIVAAEVILNSLTIPDFKGVMLVKDAALLPVKVIVEHGIRHVTSGATPTEWNLAEAAGKIDKWWTVIKVPSLAKAFKALFGSFWGRIVRLAFLIIQIGGSLFLCITLWKYLKLLTDPKLAEQILSARLFPSHKRRKEKTIIRRRVGGSAP